MAQALRYSKPTTIVVWNQGSTSVWGRTDGTLATTAAPSREVPAGQPRVFILTPENGDAVLSLAAATSAVNVTFQVFTFRSSLVAEIVGASSLLAAFFLQSFWEAVSATVIQLTGSRVEARFDTTRAKTANGNWRAASQGTGSLYLGDTTANPSSNNAVIVGVSTSWTSELDGSKIQWQDGTTNGGRGRWSPSGIEVDASDPASGASADGGSYVTRAKNNVAAVITNFNALVQAAVIVGGGAANPDIAAKHTVDGVEILRVIKRNQNGFRGISLPAAIDITAVTPSQAGSGAVAYDSAYLRQAISNGADWIVN